MGAISTVLASWVCLLSSSVLGAFLYIIKSVFSSVGLVFSCPPGCLLLPSRVSSLALQGVFSCPPGCLLLPSRVSSLAIQGVFSCPPVCLLFPSSVSSLALQGVFSCPPMCLLLPSSVSSLVLQGVFSYPPGCLLLPSNVSSLALQGVFSCPPVYLLLPPRVVCRMAFENVLCRVMWSNQASSRRRLITTRARAFHQGNPPVVSRTRPCCGRCKKYAGVSGSRSFQLLVHVCLSLLSSRPVMLQLCVVAGQRRWSEDGDSRLDRGRHW